MVICSEVEDNRGPSITNACEWIAADFIKTYGLETPVWIEHRPRTQAERQHRIKETFDLVIFSSYEVAERTNSLGEPSRRVGEPKWKALDRQSVETLVGQPV